MTYTLIERYLGLEEGTILHEFTKNDYGAKRDDEFLIKEPCIAVTENENGDYPFIIVPVSKLIESNDQLMHPPMKNSELKKDALAGCMERLVMRLWTYPLNCKTIAWTRRIRIFCDGGCPKFRWLPRFRRKHYATHWGMSGFAIYLWGREVNFSFGVDRKGLYSPHNANMEAPNA